MIEITNIETSNWETAIRGMRNPMNSWDKSDSWFRDYDGYHKINDDMSYEVPDHNGNVFIGENDLKLMKQLVSAGTDHSKFMRMIIFSCDINAPLFWISEFDTYKVGTVRNSCSFQHKGVSKPFSIRDFSLPYEVYEILDPYKEEKECPLVYDETDGEPTYFYVGDRKYIVYPNGKIFSSDYQREVNGNIKHYRGKQLLPHKTINGYYELTLGGRKHREKWMLHRIVAECFMKDSYQQGKEINHKDGNKGHNSLTNLEWVTRSENMKHAYENGLVNRTMRSNYLNWKFSTKIDDTTRMAMIEEYLNGSTQKEIAIKYDISQPYTSEIVRGKTSTTNPLFSKCYLWENIINTLNDLRDLYLETGEYDYFRAIRELLPSSYLQKFTWQANYQVLRNIYHARKNHKLDEWHKFCNMIESLPYSELITD